MQIEELIKRRGKTIPVKAPLSVKIRKSIIMLLFTLMAIIVMFSIVYLLNSSQSNQKGYEVKLKQIEQDELKKTNRDLTTKINEIKSSDSIESNPLINNLVEPETVIFAPLPKE